MHTKRVPRNGNHTPVPANRANSEAAVNAYARRTVRVRRSRTASTMRQPLMGERFIRKDVEIYLSSKSAAGLQNKTTF